MDVILAIPLGLQKKRKPRFRTRSDLFDLSRVVPSLCSAPAGSSRPFAGLKRAVSVCPVAA